MGKQVKMQSLPYVCTAVAAKKRKRQQEFEGKRQQEFEEIKMKDDGNCLYHSLAYLVYKDTGKAAYKGEEAYKQVREDIEKKMKEEYTLEERTKPAKKVFFKGKTDEKFYKNIKLRAGLKKDDKVAYRKKTRIILGTISDINEDGTYNIKVIPSLYSKFETDFKFHEVDTLEDYIDKVTKTPCAWGGGIDKYFAAQVYNKTIITYYKGDGISIKVSPENGKPDGIFRLNYINGEHYNVLVEKNDDEKNDDEVVFLRVKPPPAESRCSIY